MLKLLVLGFMLFGRPCSPADREHTCQVVVDCDGYSLIDAAIYQPGLRQWCPAFI